MYSFPQQERSFSLYEIQCLFSKGRHRVEAPLKMICRREPLSCDTNGELGSEVLCKVLFSVPKKAFKRANKRNLIRRRMKESYRLLKPEIEASLCGEKISLAFIYMGKEIKTYQEIDESIQKHIQWLLQSAKKRNSPVVATADQVL